MLTLQLHGVESIPGSLRWPKAPLRSLVSLLMKHQTTRHPYPGLCYYKIKKKRVRRHNQYHQRHLWDICILDLHLNFEVNLWVTEAVFPLREWWCLSGSVCDISPCAQHHLLCWLEVCFFWGHQYWEFLVSDRLQVFLTWIFDYLFNSFILMSFNSLKNVLLLIRQ